MATATRRCKVCGCEYEYCHTARHVAGVFRWQDVACSPDHGRIYLAQIAESRSRGNTATAKVETAFVKNPKTTAFLDEEEYDELFEEDFDDDAEEPVIET